MKIPDYIELLKSGEELLPLKQACKFFRPPISKSSSERYFRGGKGGAVLRTVKSNGQRCTTLSEIRRFELAQLENPVASSDDAPMCGIQVQKSKKIGGRMKTGRMTSDEFSAGLARHKLD